MKIRVGTRGSQLALTQTELVIEALKKHQPDLEFEIVTIKTTGDTLYNQNLALIGGKGLFLKEIEEYLIAGNIDIAVHSMKDVPAILPEKLVIDSVLPREDARDAFISTKYNTLSELYPGAVVGTASARRKAAILNLRPDLKVVLFRGNVLTRLNKLEKGEVDATILAYSGLKRLNIQHVAKHIFSYEEILPAIAQGAIGIERRKDDEKIAHIVSQINHSPTFTCIKAERSFLYHLSGDCTSPIAAYATLDNNQLTLSARFTTLNPYNTYSSIQLGDKNTAEDIGRKAAEEIKNKIKQKYLES